MNWDTASQCAAWQPAIHEIRARKRGPWFIHCIFQGSFVVDSTGVKYLKVSGSFLGS